MGRVKTLPAPQLNALDLLHHDRVVMTEDAVRRAESLWAIETLPAVTDAEVEPAVDEASDEAAEMDATELEEEAPDAEVVEETPVEEADEEREE